MKKLNMDDSNQTTGPVITCESTPPLYPLLTGCSSPTCKTFSYIRFRLKGCFDGRVSSIKAHGLGAVRGAHPLGRQSDWPAAFFYLSLMGLLLCGSLTSRADERSYFFGSGRIPLVEEVVDNNGVRQAQLNIYSSLGLLLTKTGGGNQYLIKDHLGSTNIIVDQSSAIKEGFTYTPYGETSVLLENNESSVLYRYQGQEYEPETGVYNFKARQYFPELTSFDRVDPAGVSISPYTAFRLNPIENVDVSGRNPLTFLARFFTRSVSSGSRAFSNKIKIATSQNVGFDTDDNGTRLKKWTGTLPPSEESKGWYTIGSVIPYNKEVIREFKALQEAPIENLSRTQGARGMLAALKEETPLVNHKIAYRGTYFEMDMVDNVFLWDRLLPGDIVGSGQLTSTSPDNNTATHHSDISDGHVDKSVGVHWTIRNVQGYDIAKYDLWAQKEVITDPWTLFRVNSTDIEDFEHMDIDVEKSSMRYRYTVDVTQLGTEEAAGLINSGVPITNMHTFQPHRPGLYPDIDKHMDRVSPSVVVDE
jgi:RHS repeat-associated protein